MRILPVGFGWQLVLSIFHFSFLCSHLSPLPPLILSLCSALQFPCLENLVLLSRLYLPSKPLPFSTTPARAALSLLSDSHWLSGNVSVTSATLFNRSQFCLLVNETASQLCEGKYHCLHQYDFEKRILDRPKFKIPALPFPSYNLGQITNLSLSFPPHRMGCLKEVIYKIFNTVSNTAWYLIKISFLPSESLKAQIKHRARSTTNNYQMELYWV